MPLVKIGDYDIEVGEEGGLQKISPPFLKGSVLGGVPFFAEGVLNDIDGLTGKLLETRYSVDDDHLVMERDFLGFAFRRVVRMHPLHRTLVVSLEVKNESHVNRTVRIRWELICDPSYVLVSDIERSIAFYQSRPLRLELRTQEEWVGSDAVRSSSVFVQRVPVSLDRRNRFFEILKDVGTLEGRGHIALEFTHCYLSVPIEFDSLAPGEKRSFEICFWFTRSQFDSLGLSGSAFIVDSNDWPAAVMSVSVPTYHFPELRMTSLFRRLSTPVFFADQGTLPDAVFDQIKSSPISRIFFLAKSFAGWENLEKKLLGEGKLVRRIQTTANLANIWFEVEFAVSSELGLSRDLKFDNVHILPAQPEFAIAVASGTSEPLLFFDGTNQADITRTLNQISSYSQIVLWGKSDIIPQRMFEDLARSSGKKVVRVDEKLLRRPDFPPHAAASYLAFLGAVTYIMNAAYLEKYWNPQNADLDELFDSAISYEVARRRRNGENQQQIENWLNDYSPWVKIANLPNFEAWLLANLDVIVNLGQSSLNGPPLLVVAVFSEKRWHDCISAISYAKGKKASFLMIPDPAIEVPSVSTCFNQIWELMAHGDRSFVEATLKETAGSADFIEFARQSITDLSEQDCLKVVLWRIAQIVTKLVPRDVYDSLKMLPKYAILLFPTYSILPIELMKNRIGSDDSEYLGMKYPMGRIVGEDANDTALQAYLSMLHSLGPASPSLSAGFVMIVNPTDDRNLIGSVTETVEVAREMGERAQRVVLVSGPKTGAAISKAFPNLSVKYVASRREVGRALAIEDPKVIYYSGHGGLDSAGSANLALSDGGLGATGSVIPQLRQFPFVFVNACVGALTDSPSQTVIANHGLATMFLQRGAMGYASAMWPVRDDVAREVGLGLAAHIFSVPLGFAITSAKQTAGLRNQGDLTALSYVLFGDPTSFLQEVNIPAVVAGYYDIAEVQRPQTEEPNEFQSKYEDRVSQKWVRAAGEFFLWETTEENEKLASVWKRQKLNCLAQTCRRLAWSAYYKGEGQRRENPIKAQDSYQEALSQIKKAIELAPRQFLREILEKDAASMKSELARAAR